MAGLAAPILLIPGTTRCATPHTCCHKAPLYYIMRCPPSKCSSNLTPPAPTSTPPTDPQPRRIPPHVPPAAYAPASSPNPQFPANPTPPEVQALRASSPPPTRQAHSNPNLNPTPYLLPPNPPIHLPPQPATGQACQVPVQDLRPRPQQGLGLGRGPVRLPHRGLRSRSHLVLGLLVPEISAVSKLRGTSRSIPIPVVGKLPKLQAKSTAARNQLSSYR